ncbi:MAG TPA: mechanosensitive ion channel family protein, partial [Afipia sp.]
MLDAIQYSYADMLNTLLRVPDWLTASALVIAGILLALIANTLIVHTLRNTLGVRHPKPRSRLTRSKGPLRLALIVLALGLVVRIAPIRESAATVFGNILNLAFIALLGGTAI